MWIDDYDTSTGQIGYLVETLNTSSGRTTFSLRERPLRTNRSNEPCLDGWCGETNNRSCYAQGAWRVVRRNRADDRALIKRLVGAELAASADEEVEIAPREPC